MNKRLKGKLRCSWANCSRVRSSGSRCGVSILKMQLMTLEGPGLGSVAGDGIQCTASRCGSPRCSGLCPQQTSTLQRLGFSCMLVSLCQLPPACLSMYLSPSGWVFFLPPFLSTHFFFLEVENHFTRHNQIVCTDPWDMCWCYFKHIFTFSKTIVVLFLLF